ANVMIQSGLRKTELAAAVAHEGQHLVDASKFVRSFSKDLSTWDTATNLSIQQTETNAYLVTHAVYQGANQEFRQDCSGCVLGAGVMTPADVHRAITRILTNPRGPYHDKLTER